MDTHSHLIACYTKTWLIPTVISWCVNHDEIVQQKKIISGHNHDMLKKIFSKQNPLDVIKKN